MKCDKTKENRSGWIFVNPFFLPIPVHRSRANHAYSEREGEQMTGKRKYDANRISLSPNLGKHVHRFMSVGYLFN